MSFSVAQHARLEVALPPLSVALLQRAGEYHAAHAVDVRVPPRLRRSAVARRTRAQPRLRATRARRLRAT